MGIEKKRCSRQCREGVFQHPSKVACKSLGAQLLNEIAGQVQKPIPGTYAFKIVAVLVGWPTI